MLTRTRTNTATCDAILRLGLTGNILSFLNEEFSSENSLQVEASWLLANLTAGSIQDVDELVEMRCLVVFAKALDLRNDEVHENVSIFQNTG